MSGYHDIWVLTRANNRPAIERALGNRRLSGLEFVYYDLPAWSRFWKRGERGVQLYYYFWQLGSYFVARGLHHEVGFDLIHHVTLAKYWMPSLLALLPVPFVFGPVGGAESAPWPFWADFSVRGKAYEAMRTAGRWLGEHDPLVRLTVRRSAAALAKTEETARRLRRLGAKDVRVVPGEGLTVAEIDRLAQHAPLNDGSVRFVGMGNLLHLKGFHLGLRAFAQASLKDAEYWIIGEGPERRALEALAREMGIGGQVRFWGWLSREEALRKLAESHVLVHPGLHDSGGWVCAEAMAVGRPVICLDLGGPSTQVTEQTGFRVRADNPQQAVRDLAEDMQRLAVDATLRKTMGEAGRRRTMDVFSWDSKSARLDAIYRHAVSRNHDPRPNAVVVDSRTPPPDRPEHSHRKGRAR